MLTSGLTALTIPLIERAVRSIQRAAPLATEMGGINPLASGNNSNLQRIAETAQVDPKKLEEAVQKIEAENKAAGQGKDANLAIREKALQDLGWISLFVVLIYACKYWFTRGSVYYMGKASTLLANELRVRIFERLQQLPIAYFNKKRAGAVQSVLTNDTNVYTNAVNVVRDSIDGPMKVVVGMIAVVNIQPTLALVAFLTVPLIAIVVQINSRRMKKASAVVQSDLAELQAFTQEAVQGTRVIKAFGAENRILGAYRALTDQFFRSNLRMIKQTASLKPLIEFIGAGALALMIYLCGWLAFRNQLDIAKVTALVYALDVINQGWRSMGYVRNTLAQVEAASDRIYNEVLDVPVEVEDSAAARVPDHLAGEIEFRNVSFVYPDGTPALTDVSFTIPKGSSLALVGPSGAGKSTIADLLLRFYDPTSGMILVDGVDLRELKAGWFRNQVGVVPQQTFLFAGSIAENIRMGAPDASGEEIAQAAEAAYATPFIDRQPEKFEALIGEHGVGLSGGERQRLAIARAVVRKPAVLLLDEATSNLDAESEKAVTEALEHLMQDRTTLLIAHRLTTAARADRILVLRRGEVLEVGSHRELMDRDGAYAAMYRAFGSGLLDEAMG